MTANHTIAASFKLQQFTITASAGAGCTISPSGTQTVAYGTNKTFTITPSAGYMLDALVVDGTPTGTTPLTYTFLAVAANHTIYATCRVQSLTIEATTGDGGTISPAGGGRHLWHGQDFPHDA